MSSRSCLRGVLDIKRYIVKAAYMLMAMLWGVATLFAADYFPTDTGTSWVFKYEEWTGHSGGGTHFFGLKHWKIIDKESAVQGQSGFTVLEKTELNRKTFQGFWADPFDSVFTEPRVSFDTIVFEDNGNLIYNERDQFFVHDPQGPTAAILCVKDSASEVFGETENTVLVIEGSCDMSPDDFNSGVVKHETFNYYFQKNGVGPVAYIFDSHGTQQLVGGWSWAKWTLRDPKVPIHFGRNTVLGEKKPRWKTAWRGDGLYLLDTRESKNSDSHDWTFFSLQGKVLSSGSIECGGETKIASRGTVPVSSQFMVLKISSGGHSVVMSVIYKP